MLVRVLEINMHAHTHIHKRLKNALMMRRDNEPRIMIIKETIKPSNSFVHCEDDRIMPCDQLGTLHGTQTTGTAILITTVTENTYQTWA